MSATPYSSNAAGPAWLVQARVRWQALNPRERLALLLAGWALALTLIWLLAVKPPLRTLREVPAQRAALDARFGEMRSLAQEAQGLKQARALLPDQAEAALRAATDRLGEGARLQMQGDRASVTLNGVGGSEFAAWLAEARAGAHARPVEAQLMRGSKGYSGTVVLVLGQGG